MTEFSLSVVGNNPISQDVVAPAPSGNAGYVGFFSGSEGSKGGKVTAPMLATALSNPSLGHPYLVTGKDIYSVAGAGFVILGEFQYWCQESPSKQLEAVWTSDPGRDVFAKRSALALMLLLPGQAVLPKALQPAHLAVVDMRGPQEPCISQHLRAVRRAESEEWIAANGEAAASVPPRFRVVSSFRPTSRTNKKGNPYALIEATSAPISIKQAEALNKWEKATKADPSDLENAQSYFESRRNAIADLASA